MPSWAEVQLPSSIASNTSRQFLGTGTVGAVGGTGWVTAGITGCDEVGAGAGLVGSGASGSEGCATTGVASIKPPNASQPAFKTRPPSKAEDPSMPDACLRAD